jgi:hypothetical protein
MGVTYRNAAAEQCAYTGTTGGRHVVRFQGSDYTIIGIFFRLLPDGRRALWYVLRSVLHPEDGLRMWEALPVGVHRHSPAGRGTARPVVPGEGDVALGGVVPS